MQALKPLTNELANELGCRLCAMHVCLLQVYCNYGRSHMYIGADVLLMIILLLVYAQNGGSSARLASEALATVRRDVGEFSEALTADAAELAAASAGAVDEALPELRATAAGLQEKLEVVGGGIETAGATLLANIAQARAPAAPRRRRARAAAAAAPHRAACTPACSPCSAGRAQAPHVAA